MTDCCVPYGPPRTRRRVPRPTRPSGSWTTATATARSPRCAATASASSRAICCTPAWSRPVTSPSPPAPAYAASTSPRPAMSRSRWAAPSCREESVVVTVDGRSWPARNVNMGNPHAVAFVDDLAHAGDLLAVPPFSPASVYPGGVNIEFVVDRGPGQVAMRVHERGSGETRSCGTGACAVAVATARRDGADPTQTGTPVTYTVDVLGGSLVDHRAARRHGRDDRPGRDRRRGHLRPPPGWAPRSSDGTCGTSRGRLPARAVPAKTFARTGDPDHSEREVGSAA